jgi:pimeloyl-ACP methyl ester carboxylesterase
VELRTRAFEARVNGVTLTGVEAGPREGESIVLLHGFPDFWYSWRYQIPALADAGFHVLAPNLRGYATSSKPPRVIDYTIDVLARDIVGLIDQKCEGLAHVVGHDWGGGIAWFLAMEHPEYLDRLAILNAPHPLAFRREFLRTSQWLRSWYMLFFQLPWVPEALLRFNDHALLRRALRDGPAHNVHDVTRYLAEMKRPHALKSMINYYRALVRTDAVQLLRRIDHPAILLWGDRDPHLVPQLAEGLHGAVSKLKVVRFLNAGHWVHHEEVALVNQQLIQHFRPKIPAVPALARSL